MTASLRNLRSMIRSVKFRRDHGLLPKRSFRAGPPNYPLARKLLDNYSLPEDDAKPTTQPDEESSG